MSETKTTRKKAKTKRKQPVAVSPEAREQQIASMAMDLAEKQIMDGTASPSVITHFLKIASRREKLEENYLEKKSEHISAQIESLQSSAHAEELYKNALDAMRLYSGNQESEEL